MAKKLGIKAGHRVALIGAPEGFADTLAPLPDDVTLRDQARGICNVIVLFTDRETTLRKRFDTLARRLAADGGFWIGWPKKASNVATDLSFDVVQGIGLAAGLVDNKICAIDEVYSGLRFVVRVADRANWPPAEG